MRSLDPVGWIADSREKSVCNRIHESSDSFVSRTPAKGQGLSRSWSGATITVLQRMLHCASNSTEMMPGWSVPHPLKSGSFVPFLLAVAACLFLVGAGAEGQVVIYPNLDARYGIDLPIDKYTKNVLSGLDGTGVSVVTPSGGMIFTVDLDAKASGIPTGLHSVPSDSGVSEVKSDDGFAVWHIPYSTPHVTLQSAGLRHSTTFPSLLEALREKYPSNVDMPAVRKRPYIDFGNGLLVQFPVFDPSSQGSYGADGQSFEFGNIPRSLNNPLPSLSPEEYKEFQELAVRFGELSAKELERLEELLEDGISVPTGTAPTVPPKSRPRIVVLRTPVCPNGKELPFFCKYLKRLELPECACD